MDDCEQEFWVDERSRLVACCHSKKLWMSVGLAGYLYLQQLLQL